MKYPPTAERPERRKREEKIRLRLSASIHAFMCQEISALKQGEARPVKRDADWGCRVRLAAN